MPIRRRWRPTGLAAGLVALSLWLGLAPARGAAEAGSRPTPVPSSTPDGAGWVRLAAELPDYAPAGLPDFDQRQGTWRVTSPLREAWTHDGPVAALAALWWLDSAREPAPAPPTETHDGFDLLRSQGEWDDHHAANVAPLVAELVLRAGTNGPRQLVPKGTCLDQLRDAVGEILAASREAARFEPAILERPSLRELRDVLGQGQPAVLLLGLWQEDAHVGWQRLGGHYVGLEAVDPERGRLRVADPFRDQTDPADLASAHNDARLVSHDAYLVSPSLRPGPVLRLDGYMEPPEAAAAMVANFAGLNPRRCGDLDLAWLEGARLEAQVEAALVIQPLLPPSPTPSATATDTPRATATLTATVPAPALSATPALTATATLSPTLAPSASPSPTVTASPSPSATPTPTPSPTATDTAAPSLTPSATASTTPRPPTASPSPSPTAPLSTVCGRITATEGERPIAGATVALVAGETARARAATGADGGYCLFDVPSGSYRLRAERAGCAPVERALRLSGGTERADLALDCRSRPAYLPLTIVSRPRSRSR